MLEVIIVADFNDSKAFDTVRKISNRYKDIRFKTIILNVNSVTKAWNLGILESSGEIVAVTADDIVFHPEVIATALKHLKNEKVVAVGFPAVSTKPSLSEKLHHWRFIGTVTYNAYVIMPLTFFKKHILLNDIGLYREDMGPPVSIHEDWELGSRIRKHGYRIVVDGRIVQQHLLHLRGTETKVNDENTQYTSITQIFRATIKSIRSYVKTYLERNWWTFFEVMKSSPLPQLLEYAAYLILPPTILVFLPFNPILTLSTLSTIVIFIEANSLIKRYYVTLSLKERLSYPIILTLVRIVRVYLAVIGYISNRLLNKAYR